MLKGNHKNASALGTISYLFALTLNALYMTCIYLHEIQGNYRLILEQVLFVKIVKWNTNKKGMQIEVHC